MIFYHGTTLDAAKQIQREGLKKIPSRALQIQNLQDYPFVYLLPQLDKAEMYARFRAIYDRAPYGTDMSGIPPAGYNPFVGQWTKTSTTRNPKAKPAVVTIDLPTSFRARLRRDPDSGLGLVCQCTIPPQYVRGIREVR
jgi:hypothetical protein